MANLTTMINLFSVFKRLLQYFVLWLKGHKLIFWRIIGVILACMGVLLFLLGLQTHVKEIRSLPTDDKNLVERFHNIVSERNQLGVTLAKRCCDYMKNATESASYKYYQEDIIPTLRANHIEFLITKHDSVLIWSYRYGPSDWQQLTMLQTGYIWLYGLWYHAQVYTYGDYKFAVLTHIRTDYPVQNRYLHNGWDASLSYLYQANVPTLRAQIPELFHQDETLQKTRTDNQLFYGTLLLFCLFLLLPTFFSARRRWFWSLLGSGLAWLLFFTCKYNNWLLGEVGAFFHSDIFAVSNWLASFGELFFYSLGILGTVLQLRFLTPTNESKLRSEIPLVWSIIWLALALFFLQLISSLSHLLIANSTITLTPYSFANMSGYALSAYVSLAILVALLMLSCIIASRLLQALSVWMKLLIWSGVLLINFVLLYAVFSIHSVVCGLIFGIPVLFVVFSVHRITNKPLHTGFYTVLALVNALIVCYTLDHTAQEKDIAVRSYIAETLGSEHDPTLEYMFTHLSEEIQRDSVLRAIANEEIPNLAELNRHIRHKYYRDYLLEYDYQLTFCYPETEIFLTTNQQKKNCQEFFSHMIHDYGSHLANTNFYYLDNKNGRISYLGIFNYGSAHSKLSTLYIELDSKLPHYFWGYPELLIDKKYARTPPILTVSAALYQNRKLLAQAGDYHYPIVIPQDYYELRDLQMIEQDNYTHLAKKLNVNTYAIISKPKLNFLERAGGIAYLAIIFIVIFNFVLQNSKILPVYSLFTQGLAGRIQRIILYTMLFYIPLSIICIQYIMRMSMQKDDIAHLREQIAVVQNELQNWIPKREALHRDTGYVNWALGQLSNKLYCDINLYSPAGWLIGSSRAAIFQRQLLGTRIHALAWNRLQNQSASQYFQQECVGDMHYISMYTPLYHDNELWAYINIPYLRSPLVEQQEYIHLASLILNVLLLFTCIKFFVVMQFTSHITRNLHRIRFALEDISLTSTVAPIVYKGNDEIGKLVDTYNAVVLELQRKASHLVESERESAWKEMARQIAHDIKNPLTPMKLGIQHLLLMREANVEDWDERFLKYAQMLESQIDALSQTADTFTRYATLTLGNAERTSLKGVIEQSLGLFRNHENIDWSVFLEPIATTEVYIDPLNLQRVFNNLFSNAVQALQQTSMPKIAVQARIMNNLALVTVKDNGTGIDPAIQDKIFKVNFTTKSTGLGLGLAIASNILKCAGGSISFTTAMGEGTTFLVTLPILD